MLRNKGIENEGRMELFPPLAEPPWPPSKMVRQSIPAFLASRSRVISALMGTEICHLREATVTSSPICFWISGNLINKDSGVECAAQENMEIKINK